MNSFTVKIEHVDTFVNKIGKAAASARARLRREISDIGIILAARVQNNRLRGQSLKQRSGRLVSSIHEETTESGGMIRTDVGTNVEYAGVHELGFHGSVAVKAHMRTIKKAWGKPIAPREIAVKAHPMKMNIPQRAFLEPEFTVFVPVARGRLQKLADTLGKEGFK